MNVITNLLQPRQLHDIPERIFSLWDLFCVKDYEKYKKQSRYWNKSLLKLYQLKVTKLNELKQKPIKYRVT